VLKVSRLSLYTGFDQPLEDAELGAFKQVIIRRRNGEPLAYITGEKEFWSLSFEVNPHVLIPRPDTETLVEAALKRMGKEGRALDLCTGTGCIAAALAHEKQEWTVDAVELSKEAALTATRNIERLNLQDRVRILLGDLFSQVEGESYDLISANPPYVRDGDIAGLQVEVKKEPRSALAGGPDGLDIIRRIVEQAPGFLKPGASLLIEIDPGQADVLLSDIGPRFFETPGEVVLDLSHTPRVAIFKQRYS
jgi:release factor glutamine methyltransferase